jgi:predicted enzyme related to lactoylglutathione lyase
MPNPVTHFEVSGPDAAALQSFYGSLFGWKIDADNEMNYGMVDTGEGGIGGGVGPTPDGQGHVTWYVQVADLQAALDKAESLGGKTVNPPMDVPGGPSIAHFADPAGNLIGLLKAFA